MKILATTSLAALLAAGAPAGAADLLIDLADAALVTRAAEPAVTSLAVPVAAFDGQKVPTTQAQGWVAREVWRTTGPIESTLVLFTALRQQLEVQGYDIAFACETRSCGGFDFRFGIDMLGAPDMYVDLGDFRFLAARGSDPELPEWVTMMVSRGGERGYVEIATVSAPSAEPAPAQAAAPVTLSTRTPDAADDLELGEALAQFGSAVLSDIRFAPGAAALAGDSAMLAELAGYLNDHPERHVMLVGHTDATGSLKANIALSKARAEAVREALITRFGVRPEQVGADGVGWLSPRATNETEDGRARNRRVEVVLTPAE